MAHHISPAAGVPPEPLAGGVTLLGPRGSGKSTFLCGLRQALLEQDEPWQLFARDDDLASQRVLDTMSSGLVSEGAFPPPTEGVETYHWVLNGPVERTRPGGLFRAAATVTERAEVSLRVTDASGDLGHPAQGGQADRKELVGRLADSHGLLYLFDPVREFTHGDSFQLLDGLLAELMGLTGPDERGRLPHRVAVCVTKLDDPRVFSTAQNLGILHPDDRDGLGFPRVCPDGARRLLGGLCAISKTGTGDALPRLLDRYFGAERISFHATSATGFMVNQYSRRFDWRDTVNVYETESGTPVIRGPVHPVGVAEPVLEIVRELIR